MSLRASSYNIYVDLPNVSDFMIITHGYLGSYDKISAKVAKYLRSKQRGKPFKPLYGDWTPEAAIKGEIEVPDDATIELLKKRGYLTEKTHQEEENFFVSIANKIHSISLNQPPSYVFMPTYNCNLRCPYCFQDHMRTNTELRHLLKTMDKGVIDDIFSAIQSLEGLHSWHNDGNTPRYSIGFFGGEPLLRESFNVVEYILRVAKTTGNVTGVWAVSNATDLHHYSDLLGPDGIQTIQITLDGPPAEHNKRRVYADNSGSFERIAQNIDIALQRGTNISVRMNIDKNNIDQLPALAQEIISRGWNDHDKFTAYTAPIHASNEKTDKKTTFTSWTLNKALDGLRLKEPAMSIIDRPADSLKRKVLRLFNDKEGTLDPIQTMRSTFCGAHNGMYLFDAFRDVYACWERTGDKRIRIGYIDQGKFISNDSVEHLWRSRNVTTNKVCRKCRYALHCGGGCAALAESQSTGIFRNHCDGFQDRFRAAVAEAFTEHIQDIASSLSLSSFCTD